MKYGIFKANFKFCTHLVNVSSPGYCCVQKLDRLAYCFCTAVLSSVWEKHLNLKVKHDLKRLWSLAKISSLYLKDPIVLQNFFPSFTGGRPVPMVQVVLLYTNLLASTVLLSGSVNLLWMLIASRWSLEVSAGVVCSLKMVDIQSSLSCPDP